MCAGLIGYRSLVMAGSVQEATHLGIYGFGGAAHIIAQVAMHEGRQIYAFTRPGKKSDQEFARSLGAAWAGGSDELPPHAIGRRYYFCSCRTIGCRGPKRGAKGMSGHLWRNPHE